VNLAFSSHAPKESRGELEELLFLNPRQHRVRAGIVRSLERFGHPEVVETATGLGVRIGKLEAQNLFAFDRDQVSDAPVGIVVFSRTSPAEMTVLHVAVHPDYALYSDPGGGLGITLVEQVKAIAARIVGIERVVFFYRQEVVLRL